MAISRLASQDATGTSTAASSVSATYAATPTANNLLVAVIGDTDGLNNATSISGWQVLAGTFNGNTNEINFFGKVATGAESTTVTATTTAGTTSCMAIYEYTGIQPGKTIIQLDDGHNGATASSTNAVSTGTIPTTSNAFDLVMVGGFTTGVAETFSSWSNSFNLRNSVIQTTFSLFTGDQIVSATAAYTSTLTTSTNFTLASAAIQTFKGVGGGVKELTTLGAG